jgi:RHS repeat-associated protein
VNLPDGRTIEYVVDAAGRRIGKKVNGVLIRGWLYRDKLRPVAELDGTGAVVSRFVYANRPNVPEYMIKGGAAYRLVLDNLGSPILVVNSATGAVAEQVDRDEFGVVRSDSAPGTVPFGFAGGIYDQDTGLLRFGSRDYDPVVGKWTRPDPALFRGGSANFREYANGDPINYMDPTGRDIWIEGASGNEPAFHQSINIGDPMGEYDSYSFAINGGGTVYEDTDMGGEIEHYFKTTPDQDERAIAELLSSVQSDDQMWYGPNTCRSYSQEKFDQFRQELNGTETAPPPRTPVPRSYWREPLSTSSTSTLFRGSLVRLFAWFSTSTGA